MKSLLALILLICNFAFAQVPGGEYKCECFPSVPFETYQIYVVEKIGAEENWYLLEERPTHYDDRPSCEKAMEGNPICQSFLKTK